MLKLAIMQPYFLPYLGYWQLLAAVDRLVLYDDVQFIRNGWINRNRYLGKAGPAYITIPVARQSYLGPIHDARIADRPDWVAAMRRRVQAAYSQAPQRHLGLDLLDELLADPGDDLNDLVCRSVQRVSHRLGLSTEIVRARGRWPNRELRGADRVIDICRREGATHYFNLPGGQALYDAGAFERQGVALRYLEPTLSPYAQGSISGGSFVPALSVIDTVMWLGWSATAELARLGQLAR